jgi:hypothetical protein
MNRRMALFALATLILPTSVLARGGSRGGGGGGRRSGSSGGGGGGGALILVLLIAGAGVGWVWRRLSGRHPVRTFRPAPFDPEPTRVDPEPTQARADTVFEVTLVSMAADSPQRRVVDDKDAASAAETALRALSFSCPGVSWRVTDCQTH